jgi:hypothetical protein
LELAQRLQAHSPRTTTDSSGLQAVDDNKQDDITAVSGPSNRPNSPRLDADNVSVISNAFSAISLASKLKKSSSTASFDRETRRFQPSLEPVIATSPVLDALTAATEREVIDAFIDEIVGLSEELQLYSQNPSLPQSPQQLVRITSTAMKLCDSLQPQHYGRSTSPRLNLPEVESPIESFKESIFSTLSKYSDDTSVTKLSPTQPDPTGISQSFADKGTSTVDKDSHPTNPMETRPGPHRREGTFASVPPPERKRPLSVSQSGTFIMDIGPPAKQSLAFTARLFEARIVGVAAIECTLDFADANESTPFCLITATAVNQRRKTRSSLSDAGSLALTPQTHLDLPNIDEINRVADSREHRRIFHHRFMPGRRPFPHILHPDVEGPGRERNAPCTITFTVSRDFEEEGVPSSPKGSTMLKYILSDEKHRDILQSLIFGKALLFSAGINKVITTGQKNHRCDAQQAVQMWLSKNHKAKSITVYFKDNKQHEKLYKEYRVHGLKSDPHRLRPRAPIEVMVAEESPLGPNDSGRRSSTISAHTISSIGSEESTTSNLMTCCLHFSKDEDRAKFLRFFESSFNVVEFLCAKYCGGAETTPSADRLTHVVCSLHR